MKSRESAREESRTESICACRYRDPLLQCEIDQGLAWHPNLVSIRDGFGSCSHARLTPSSGRPQSPVAVIVRLEEWEAFHFALRRAPGRSPEG